MQGEAGADRAILWDNDGVLVDTEPVFFEANRRELAVVGVAASWADFEEISLRRGESLLSLSGLHGDDLGALFTRRDALYSELLSSGEIVMAGMGDLLERLAPRFRMVVVTSSRRKHFEVIHARSGLMRHFEFHVVREDYRLGKPHPDGYLEALYRIGLPADRCLAVEDSPRGVASAQAAGLEVVLFAPGGTGSEREVGNVLARVTNAEELEEVLDDWAGRVP
ncbi:MAG: HAD family phosphatase [Dehalococcoidia bacterium]|nr:HAD family phosphatase [Dehalococcoidia bacterium]